MSNSTVNSNAALKLEPQLKGNGDCTETSIIRRFRYAVDQKLFKEFTPAYFAPVMGQHLVQFHVPCEMGRDMWVYNVCDRGDFIFPVISICLLVSMLIYPSKFKVYHNDPAIAPFMGCLPMGYTTLVNTLYYQTGTRWIVGIWVLWWISVVLSLYTALYTAFLAKRKSGYRITSNSHYSPT